MLWQCQRMEAPQIVTIAFMAMGLGITVAKHGKPRADYNALEHLVNVALTAALLAWGGFWT